MSANWLYGSKKTTDVLFEILNLEQSWQDSFSLSKLHAELDSVVTELSARLSEKDDVQTRLYTVLDQMLDELAFSGPGMQALPDSSLTNLSYCIMHRTGSHIAMAVLYLHLLTRLGFDAYIADMDKDIALMVKASNSELLVVDPISGGSEYLISNDDVKSSIVSDLAGYISPIEEEELIKIVLTEQKVALLNEDMFESALSCVETLMELLPEDPYERRDRGLVLNQLDCSKWAKEDFDYFIKACPNDPMAMFIRMQLEEQSNIVETIH